MPGRRASYRPLDGLVAEWNKSGQAPGIADLPAIGDKLQRGQPVVTILVDGGSLAEVEANLRFRMSIAEKRLF